MGVNTMQCTTPTYTQVQCFIFIINALFEGMTCSGGFRNNDDELVDFLHDVYVFWTNTSIDIETIYIFLALL